MLSRSIPYLSLDFDAELYLHQNLRSSTRRRRLLRVTLRSLESTSSHDTPVTWLYSTSDLVGKKGLFSSWFTGSSSPTRYDSVVTYTECRLEIVRQGELSFDGGETDGSHLGSKGKTHWRWNCLSHCSTQPSPSSNLGSGFEVRLRYAKNVAADCNTIGLTDDFELTDKLAAFLRVNSTRIEARLPGVIARLERYRQAARKEVVLKERVMTYGFLRDVYGSWKPKEALGRVLEQECEGSKTGPSIVRDYRHVFVSLDERMRAVGRSPACGLWYLFWVSLWHCAFRCKDFGLKKAFVDLIFLDSCFLTVCLLYSHMHRTNFGVVITS